MVDDVTLLRRYAEENSEEAFAELVRRRLGLVYGVALRHTNHAQRAEDATQRVFTDLARKAASLAKYSALVGWLHRSARFAAAEAVRGERRRQVREQEAIVMQQIDREASEPDWNALRPVLDEVLDRLSDTDRDAVLQRFFDAQSFAEIGRRYRLTENAARMRVERALGKMQAALTRRGVTSTTGALALALTGSASAATPAGLAGTVAGIALGAAKASGVVAAVGAWTFMGATKLQIGVVGAIVGLGLLGVALQSQRVGDLNAELGRLTDENRSLAQLRDENRRLAATAASLRQDELDTTELARLQREAAELREKAAGKVGPVRPAMAWPNGHPIFEPAEVDVQPVAKFKEGPSFPSEMRRLGVSGEAVLEFVVDHEGTVQDVTVASATPPEAGAAALRALKNWRFEPARKKGAPANVRQRLPMTFTARTRTSPPGWF